MSYPRLTGTNRPLGTDTSANNGKVDGGVMKENGVLFAASRSTIGSSYQDKWYPQHIEEWKKNGIYRMSYHVVWPGVGALAQMDNFYRVAQDRLHGRVLDWEPTSAGLASSSIFWQCVEIIMQRDGVYPWAYSRYRVMNQYLNWSDWQKDQLNWWLAQYSWNRITEYSDPTLPNGVNKENVIIHQTADKALRFPGSVESWALDRDRWMYPADHMVDFFEGVEAPLPEPVQEVKIRVITPILNVRAGPGTNFADVGNVYAGEIKPVLQIAGSSAWAEIAPGNWIAITYNGVRHSELVK